MSLESDLLRELTGRVGQMSGSPEVIALHHPSGLRLEITLTAVDSLSCAFRELSLFVPALQTAPFSVLEAWGQNLSQRITYLLEQISPLEINPHSGEVLIRSTAPDQLPDGTRYYEIILTRSSGRFVLTRFRSVKGTSGRTQVDLQMTHEVLLKLVRDVEAALP